MKLQMTNKTDNNGKDLRWNIREFHLYILPSVNEDLQRHVRYDVVFMFQHGYKLCKTRLAPKGIWKHHGKSLQTSKQGFQWNQR